MITISKGVNEQHLHYDIVLIGIDVIPNDTKIKFISATRDGIKYIVSHNEWLRESNIYDFPTLQHMHVVKFDDLIIQDLRGLIMYYNDGDADIELSDYEERMIRTCIKECVNKAYSLHGKNVLNFREHNADTTITLIQ